MVDDRGQVGLSPPRPVSLGDEPAQLDGHVGQCAKPGHVRPPGPQVARGDRRLARVVEHEPHVRQGRGRLGDERQLLGRNHHVVGEPGGGHGGQPVPYAGPGQIPGVGLDLELMTDAGQLAAAGRCLESSHGHGHVQALQVHPANHAGQPQRRRGQREQVEGLASGVAGLDCHCGVHAVRVQHQFQVWKQERPLQRGKLRCPRLRPCRQIPQVHVGVDDGHVRGRSRRPVRLWARRMRLLLLSNCHWSTTASSG